MSRFTVVGAGPTGSAVSTQLVAAGHDVVLVTRRGSGPQHDRLTKVAADATDAQRLSELTTESRAVFNCANPAYHRWPTDWPPLANALLAAAQSSGATLVTLSNLYVYGRPTGPMTPKDPMSATYEKAQVRATMWKDALALHDAGKIRAVEVRASDFIGPIGNAMMGDRIIPRILKGQSCTVVGNPDAPHTWTYIDDVATTLVACAMDDSSWGQVWHVPSNAAKSSREVIIDLATAAGVKPGKVHAVPRAALVVAGLFSPLMRELPKTLYQFEGPFVMDDSATREHFALAPTDWSKVISATLNLSVR